MVIALTGVLAAVVGRFIVQPVRGYLDTRERAALVDEAAAALQRMARELRSALPNSARVAASGKALEFVPVTAVGRYATEGSGRLDFTTADTSFAVLGPALAVQAGQWLVFYNLGTGVVGSDAYAAIGSAGAEASANRRSVSGAGGSLSTVTLDSLAALPSAAFAPPYRVHVVNAPVTFRCDTAAGTLVRTTGYGFNATQVEAPSGGSSTVLATGVTDCAFSYDSGLATTRAALAGLRLTLSRTTTAGAESITLHHAVHVDNLP